MLHLRLQAPRNMPRICTLPCNSCLTAQINTGETCFDTYTVSVTCEDEGAAGPSGDPCSSAVVKEDFYVDGASLCSLATIGSPLHSTKVATSADCCAACAAHSSSPSCNVFNFCNAETG